MTNYGVKGKVIEEGITVKVPLEWGMGKQVEHVASILKKKAPHQFNPVRNPSTKKRYGQHIGRLRLESMNCKDGCRCFRYTYSQEIVID